LEHPLFIKHRELIKFVLVGFTNTAVDFLLYALLANAFGVWPVLANLVSVAIAMCVSFYLNMTFVWRSSKTIRETAPKFFAATIFTGWGVQGSVIWVLAGLLGSGEWQNLAAKVSAVAIGLALNYLFYKIIFTGKRNDKKAHRA
jgi:putative flippase GtrA